MTAAQRILGLLAAGLWLVLAPFAAGLAAEPVGLRAALHDGFARLVFDWGGEVDYQARLEGDSLVVSFSRPGSFDPEGSLRVLRDHIVAAQVSTDNRSLTFTLNGPQEVSHFALPGRVVIDLGSLEKRAASVERAASAGAAMPPLPRRRPLNVIAETAPASSRSLPTSRAESRDVPMPWSAPVAAIRVAGQAKGHTPVKARKAEPRQVVPAAAATAMAPALGEIQVVMAAQATGDDMPLPGRGAVPLERFGLRLTWDRLPAAAAFRFGDDIWLLFEGSLPEKTGGLIEGATGHAAVTQAVSGQGTVLRIKAPPQLAPRLRAEGGTWLIDIRQRTPLPELAISSSLVNDDRDTMIRYALPKGSKTHWLLDPQSKERLIVVPTLAVGEGVALDRSLPQFVALQSQQGLVVRPFVEGLEVAVSSYGVLLRHPNGLLASSQAARGISSEDPRAGEAGGRLFDLAAWRHGERESFATQKQELLHAVVTASGRQALAARIDLARFYFAWGLTTEALGLLDVIEAQEPALAEDPERHLLRAAGALLLDDYASAARLLSDPSLSGEVEALLWQAAYAATAQDWPAAASGFSASDRLIAAYPESVRKRLLLLAAEARLGIGDSGGASEYLLAAAETPLSKAEAAQVKLLTAKRLQLDGRPEMAKALFQELRHASHQASQARARLALIEIALAEGTADQGDLLAELERLRFAWRGDEFELAVLLRLADLYVKERHHRRALDVLRQAASYFPDQARARQVAARMRDVYQGIFLNETGPTVPPLAALALYQEFKELTPSGPAGDRVLRRLADRLVEIDLLDQAAAVLEDLLHYRLTGADKAEAGARLALIRLLDQDPAAALLSLDDSAVEHALPALAGERRWLRARALTGLARYADALALIAGDDSFEAVSLQAEIYAKIEVWPQAALALTRLLPAEPPQSPLSEDQSELVMNLAIATTLAGNEAELARLYRDYAKTMAATRHGDAFELLASGLDVEGQESIAQSLSLSDKARRFLDGYQGQP